MSSSIRITKVNGTSTGFYGSVYFDVGDTISISGSVSNETINRKDNVYIYNSSSKAYENKSRPYTYNRSYACLFVFAHINSVYYLIHQCYIGFAEWVSDEDFGDTGKITGVSSISNEITFQVPPWIPNGAKLYAKMMVGTSYNSGDAGDPIDNHIGFETNPSDTSGLTAIATCSRKYTIPDISITYPRFTCSEYAKVSFPEILNTLKMEFYRSTDEGLNWTKIYNTETATSMTASSSWTVDTFLGAKTMTLNLAHPIPAQTITLTDATTTCKYKVIYYNESTSKEAIGGLIDIFDMTLPTTTPFTEFADYNNRIPEKLVIAKSTISDLSRVGLQQHFGVTELPNTIQTLSSGVLEYDLQMLDDDNSLTTNLGNYFKLKNANYVYRIYPLLDGATEYKSTNNNAFEKLTYTKATTKLEMTRPIEMGAIQPTKIKLLINPAIGALPSGASLTFYVANNGNDDTIAWEELPSSCLGTTANPDCDIYYFSNESKTADTWKVMIKAVADKGTSSSDVSLSSMVVVINGGEKDTRPSGYKYLNNVILDTTATTVSLEVPQGYRKYKIIGNIINTNKSGNPYIILNSLTSGYDSYYTVFNSTSGTSKSDRFLDTVTTIGICPQFEMDMFCYNSKWYGSMSTRGDVGSSNSHGMISISGDLTTIKVVCASTSYPMQAGTEFTVLGVD